MEVAGEKPKKRTERDIELEMADDYVLDLHSKYSERQS